MTPPHRLHRRLRTHVAAAWALSMGAWAAALSVAAQPVTPVTVPPVPAYDATPATPATPASAATAAPASAPAAPRPGAAAPTAVSFDIVVRAPEPLKEMLEEHLTLQRYRGLPDLEEEELDRLVALAEQEVRQLVATRGFFAPLVEMRVDRTPLPIQVIVTVVPREPAVVSEVDIAFEGEITRTPAPIALGQMETIRSEWALPPGERFTQEEWAAAKAQALDTLVAVRYPRGRISYSIAAVNALAGRAQLGLRLDSGPLFTLGPLVITGAERYPPLVAERIARLPLGSVYDRQDILEAQLRLTGSSYYETAFLYVDPDSDPNAAPVLVNLREAPVHQWVLGVGLTTDFGPHATVEYSNNRFPTWFWRTETRLRISRENPSAEVDLLSIPGEDGWRWGALASAGRNLDDDGQDVRFLRLRAGRSRITDNISREYYLEFDRASVDDASDALTRLERGEGTALFANYISTWRYFDHPDLPTSGYGFGLEAGAGVTLTGDRSLFQRTVLRWKQFIPFEPSRLQLRAEAGAVFAPDAAEIPATQLFRTGGDTTVRGYGYREIGVTRPNGVDVPGRYLLVGSAEWMRPLRFNDQPSNLEQTFFIDAGAVADSPGELDPVFGIGTGIRYTSPIGPLQASIAYGLESRRLRLHLTVGVTF